MTADVRIGGEHAPGLSVNIIDDDASYAPTVPPAAPAMNTAFH